MRIFAIILLIYLTTHSSSICQNISGSWSGKITQESQPNVLIIMEVSVRQVNNNLTGQIKISSSYGFVIEKFRGEINGSKIIMNEYEVIQQKHSLNTGWCLKNFEGLLEVNVSENKRTIEGVWTSNRAYENSTYINSNCPPGAFVISQQLPPKPQPLEKPAVIESIISGEIIDKQTRKPVKAILSIIGNKSPLQTISTGNDGSYSFKAPINDVSDIEITENGYEPLRESIKIDNANLTRNFFLIPKRNSPPVKEEFSSLPPSIVVNGQTLKKGESIALNSIQFEQTQSDLLPEGKSELNKVIQLMKEYPTLIIELSGHTSNEEKKESMNVRLSEERVAACKNYIANQVENANSRVKTVGYSSSKPRASNNSDENRKKNRRVELKIESL